MDEYKLQLSATKEMSWEAKHPVITFWCAFLSQIFVDLSYPSSEKKRWDTDDGLLDLSQCSRLAKS